MLLDGDEARPQAHNGGLLGKAAKGLECLGGGTPSRSGAASSGGFCCVHWWVGLKVPKSGGCVL